MPINIIYNGKEGGRPRGCCLDRRDMKIVRVDAVFNLVNPRAGSFVILGAA